MNKDNFNHIRKTMLDCQIRPAGIESHAILTAFAQIKRENFVPSAQQHLAYCDSHIKLSQNRHLLSPTSLAILLQLANPSPEDKVLDIGSGTGYSSSIFSKLCANVIALENNESLLQHAKKSLLPYKNVQLIQGELSQGCVAHAPYDIIFINGAIEHLPETLGRQIESGGRIIAVQGVGNSGVAGIYEIQGGSLHFTPHFSCALPLLDEFISVHEFTF